MANNRQSWMISAFLQIPWFFQVGTWFSMRLGTLDPESAEQSPAIGPFYADWSRKFVWEATTCWHLSLTITSGTTDIMKWIHSLCWRTTQISFILSPLNFTYDFLMGQNFHKWLHNSFITHSNKSCHFSLQMSLIKYSILHVIGN